MSSNLMNYDDACREFNVKPTKRQKRKWVNGEGRAFKLSTALSSQVIIRRGLNKGVEDLNRQIADYNEGRPEEVQQAYSEPQDEFTHADVLRVLGQ